MQREGSFIGGVVGTLMSNYGLEQACVRDGIPFVRANVGDRYVMAELAQRDWLLGGESSGHIVCRHLTSTGDGTVAALQVLRAMVETGSSLADLRKGMTRLPQRMINVRLQEKVDIKEIPAIADAVSATEATLDGRGRVLLRPSGTEPVIRVMIEGEVEDEVSSLCETLAQQVENAIQALEK